VEQADRHVGTIGDKTIDTEVEEAIHCGTVINCPDVNFHPRSVQRGYGAAGHHTNSPGTERDLHRVESTEGVPGQRWDSQLRANQGECHPGKRCRCRDAGQQTHCGLATPFTERRDQHTISRPRHPNRHDRGFDGLGGLDVDVQAGIGERVQEFCQRHKTLALAKVDPLQLCVRQVADLVGSSRQPSQVGIVTDDRHTIAAGVYVDLEVRSTHGQRTEERQECVVGQVNGKPAVREHPRQWQVEVGRKGRALTRGDS